MQKLVLDAKLMAHYEVYEDRFIFVATDKDNELLHL